ncbi:LPS assembly lipoprotein LptE [Stieleria sp. TO1_6]|uniref:LptE family protein n=1 Tax=Stieleria tagensis TaxID=2956795 RepID=UPI00209A663C|nr:LptE family protein [Stieleria tagensis]MCO8123685.1 LPS assembly lipoprotein LptE [Stieleria tagensis]
MITVSPSSKIAGAVCTLMLLAMGGCASYQYGSAALFPSGIRTVYVPFVRNDTYRFDLGPQLTEALVDEIERRTPYKVVGNPNADTTLQCVITDQSKVVLTETSSDDPRALDTAIYVAANWTTRDGQRLMQNSLASYEADQIGFSQSARFVPEAGQSIDTANHAAIELLARRIVSQMEARW